MQCLVWIVSNRGSSLLVIFRLRRSDLCSSPTTTSECEKRHRWDCSRSSENCFYIQIVVRGTSTRRRVIRSLQAGVVTRRQYVDDRPFRAHRPASVSSIIAGSIHGVVGLLLSPRTKNPQKTYSCSPRIKIRTPALQGRRIHSIVSLSACCKCCRSLNGIVSAGHHVSNFAPFPPKARPDPQTLVTITSPIIAFPPF